MSQSAPGPSGSSAGPGSSAGTSTTDTAPVRMSDTVALHFDGTTAVITLDNPPVNGLGDTIRQGLSAALDAIVDRPETTAVVLTGAGRAFSGGADVRQLGTPAFTAGPPMSELLARMLELKIPVIAAIHGFALGGGLELSMGCHYRIAERTAKLGLPEVNLGLIPGGGGTQRLPRLIGAGPALDLIISAEHIDAERALELGIVDALFEGDPVQAAIHFVDGCADDGTAHRVIDGIERAEPAGADFDAARAAARRNRRNSRAQLAAITAVEASVTSDISTGLGVERAEFEQLVGSPEATALSYLFFAERTAARIDSIPKDTPLRDIRSAAVIGSGTMGVGIAMSFADAGIPVGLVDRSQEALERARSTVARTYERSVVKGRITAAEADQRRGLITPATSYDAAAQVDIIVEAVFEDLEVKKEVFAELDRIRRPGSILATNTSRLDVNEIAAATSAPADVIGLHFFSPAHVMRLLEVVQGAQTADDVLATSMALAQRIGKLPVLAQVCDGFIGNRMLSPYRREAEQLLEQGASPRQVDAALQDFGMAMGPFAMSDLAGIDVGEAGRRRFRETADPVLLASQSDISTRLFEAGRYGQKTGAGFYRYEDGDRTPHEDPVVEEIIAACAAERGVTRREVADEEIVERCMLALVNEGATLLDEGIAQRASDIDVVWANGYGFPAYRGGPMHYATTLGLATVVERMRELQQTVGEYWKPAELLERLVAAGRTDFSEVGGR
ncbi:3-hydroxyacyl-CoA dehydrogenase NAD-binding domain-containing protein [Brevibacterium daeguense]|uniref:3-hydroxyacyl-CoA dehydrogenase NAD-binding domain-containing protein n=2 Tax=Brevibacterium daeguense TaxID=909936 RepID=A0ABP8EFI6_9MICO